MINSNVATTRSVKPAFPFQSSLLAVEKDTNAQSVTLRLRGRFIDVREVVDRWHMKVEWGKGVGDPDGQCVVVGTLGVRT